MSSLDSLDMGNSENIELWPCFGVGCAFFFFFLIKKKIFICCSMGNLF